MAVARRLGPGASSSSTHGFLDLDDEKRTVRYLACPSREFSGTTSKPNLRQDGRPLFNLSYPLLFTHMLTNMGAVDFYKLDV